MAPALPGPVEALVGHSLGGKVVLAAQRASGQRFPRTVVLDASPSARPDGLGAEQSRDVLALLARLPHRIRKPAPSSSPPWRPAGSRGTSPSGWRCPSSQKAREFRLSLDLPGLESLFRSVLSRGRLGRGDLRARRHRLAFVVGGRSAVVEPAARTRLATLGPAVTVEEIPGAGHWLQVDAPEATFGAVERALS